LAVNKKTTKKSAKKAAKKAVKKKEAVNHPKHYNMGKIEVIDVIEDWGLGFNDGNVVKYVGRAPHKETELQDLKKGLWYLQRHIGNVEKRLKKEGKI